MFTSEMDAVRLVLFDQPGGHEPRRQSPDKVHLDVDGAQGESRLEDQKDAAIKEKARPDQPRHHGYPMVARARDGDHADGDAGRNEDAERQVKSDHTALQQARAAGQLVQLLKDHGATLFVKLHLRRLVRQFLQTIRERTDSINDTAQARRSREDHRAAGRDQHGGRNHGREHGER